MAEPNKHITDFILYAEKEKGYSAHTIKSYTNDLNRFDHFMKTYTNDPQWAFDTIDINSIESPLRKALAAGPLLADLPLLSHFVNICKKMV